MSENNERKLENMEEKAKPRRRNRRKKRRKSRVTLRLAVFLIVIAMLFGLVVGYAVGRATGTARMGAAEKRIEELTDAAEEAGRQEIDIFTDALSPENRAALADLSGLSMQSSEGNVFLGEDDTFTGISDSAESDPVVVAEFRGGELMSDEVSREYNQRLAAYIFSGYTEEEIAAKLLDEVMLDMVTERVLQAKAEELGANTLTSADSQQIAARAQEQYSAQLDMYRNFVYTEGMSEADVIAAAQAFLADSEGVTLDSVRADIEKDWWKQKLREEAAKDVQVNSSEILAAYNRLLDEQKETFTADPAEFEAAQQRGDLILYNLSGYRAVKPLVIRMSDGLAGEAMELQGALELLGEGGDAQQLAEIRSRLDECYAGVEAEAAELLGRLNSGMSFDSLLAQYGDDEGMKNPALQKSGYYIKADSKSLPEEVVAAAMEMSRAGEVSAVIRTADGVCILQYVGEVRGGDVDMATVYDAITADARAEAQDMAFDAKTAAWLEEAGAKYYPERMS